ncbi:ABC-three component system middle component 1 [Vibrio vulnificus]|uniref:ABC-three component system middle component 1 n=1 Tax=Vibrio vulnificus TaxID=672 RepID=UPI003D9C8A89
MGNLFDKLMESILIASGLSLARIEFVEKTYGISTNLYVSHKPNSDYFVYLFLPENVLSSVSNDIQIKLLSAIKNDLDSMELLSGESVAISSSFEKNVTLIIFSIKGESSTINVDKQAIEIEEDPYFFKKQVLIVSSEDIDIISSSFEENRGNYTSYLKSIISDPQLFNEFMNSKKSNQNKKVIEYTFAAKLYEKLPFLALSVKESSPEDLQVNIDDVLSEYQREQCEILLGLDVNNLSNWLDDIVKEESDA